MATLAELYAKRKALGANLVYANARERDARMEVASLKQKWEEANREIGLAIQALDGTPEEIGK